MRNDAQKKLFREECERKNIKTKYVKCCLKCIQVAPEEIELCVLCGRKMTLVRRSRLCW